MWALDRTNSISNIKKSIHKKTAGNKWSVKSKISGIRGNSSGINKRGSINIIDQYKTLISPSNLFIKS